MFLSLLELLLLLLLVSSSRDRLTCAERDEDTLRGMPGCLNCSSGLSATCALITTSLSLLLLLLLIFLSNNSSCAFVEDDYDNGKEAIFAFIN